MICKLTSKFVRMGNNLVQIWTNTNLKLTKNYLNLISRTPTLDFDCTKKRKIELIFL
jgi:hypothetical protein